MWDSSGFYRRKNEKPRNQFTQLVRLRARAAIEISNAGPTHSSYGSDAGEEPLKDL